MKGNLINKPEMWFWRASHGLRCLCVMMLISLVNVWIFHFRHCEYWGEQLSSNKFVMSMYVLIWEEAIYFQWTGNLFKTQAAWTDLRLRRKTSQSNSKLDLVVFIVVWVSLVCRPLQAAVKHTGRSWTDGNETDPAAGLSDSCFISWRAFLIRSTDAHGPRLSLNASSYFTLSPRLDSMKYTLVAFIHF